MCVLYRSIPLLDFCGSRAFVLTRRCRFPRRPVGLAASPSSSAVQGPTASAFRALERFRLFFPKFCFFCVFLCSNILTLFILILKKDMCSCVLYTAVAKSSCRSCWDEHYSWEMCCRCSAPIFGGSRIFGHFSSLFREKNPIASY